jgi:hypothetical protein
LDWLIPYTSRWWFYPLLLLMVGVGVYGYAWGSLGYFWDDWEVVFLLNARDPSLLSGYFAFDRPFAWPYQAMYALFGLNPIAWHAMTLLFRWAGILFLYLTLRTTWPRLEGYLRWLGVLLLVYPGYVQQSTSAAYNRHFTAFFLFALSLYLMALAIRRPSRAGWLMPLAWILSFVQAFTIEYFVGLELVRPVLIWILVSQATPENRRQSLGKAAFLYVPFLLILAFYIWWRLVVFPSTIPIANYAGDFKLLQDFNTSFLAGVLAVLTRLTLDLIYSTVQVWLSAISDPDVLTFQSKIAWLALALGAIIAGLFAWLYPAVSRDDDDQDMPTRSFAMLGLWAFLVSGLPIWLTSKQLSGGGRYDDRFTLAPMLGAGILTIALIIWLVRRRHRTALLAILLLLSVVVQVISVNRYRLDWSVQNAYYWQVAWRVPALEAGTAIISWEQPAPSIPGYDASFAYNVLYGGSAPDGAVPFWFFTNDRFLNFDLKPGKPIVYKDRNLKFTGSTSNAIAIVHQGEKRCVQVVDKAYADQPFYAAGQEQLVAVSNTDRILADTQPRLPSQQIFGPEPAHTWCYYFEKADLARQLGDWDTIIDLDRHARAASLAPAFGPEFIPFIEAYANRGDWQQAIQLSTAAQNSVAEMEPLLCSTWKRLAALPSADQQVVQQARETLGCKSP